MTPLPPLFISHHVIHTIHTETPPLSFYFANPPYTILQNLVNYAASQHKQEKTMFDFKDVEKKYQDLTKQIQQLNEFWLNAIISSLKQFTK